MRPFLLACVAIIAFGALMFVTSSGCEDSTHVAIPIYEAGTPIITPAMDSGSGDAAAEASDGEPGDAVAESAADGGGDAAMDGAAEASQALDGGEGG
jgi:hypothetical protein